MTKKKKKKKKKKKCCRVAYLFVISSVLGELKLFRGGLSSLMEPLLRREKFRMVFVMFLIGPKLYTIVFIHQYKYWWITIIWLISTLCCDRKKVYIIQCNHIPLLSFTLDKFVRKLLHLPDSYIVKTKI